MARENLFNKKQSVFSSFCNAFWEWWPSASVRTRRTVLLTMWSPPPHSYLSKLLDEQVEWKTARCGAVRRGAQRRGIIGAPIGSLQIIWFQDASLLTMALFRELSISDPVDHYGLHLLQTRISRTWLKNIHRPLSAGHLHCNFLR